MRIAERKESPIIGLTGMGGGLASYILYGSGSSGSAYEISRSLRLDGSSSYLSSPDLSSVTFTSLTKGTIACWFKRSDLGAGVLAAGWQGGVSYSGSIQFNSSDDTLQVGIGGAAEHLFKTNATFRDASAWYHIVVHWDRDASANADKVKVWVNGVAQTSSSTTYQDWTSGDSQIFVANGGNRIGRGDNDRYDNYFGGYIADYHFVDGQALDETSFGEYDSYGIWNPKEYTGTHGNAGFHLKFDNNTSTTTLGTDSSSNSNDWTLSNFSVASGSGNDSLLDSPTNYSADSGNNGGNYATLNLLALYNATLSNGNLEWTLSNASLGAACPATIAMSSGKYYCEVVPGNNTQLLVGLIRSSYAGPYNYYVGYGQYAPNTYGYYQGDGTKYINGTSTSYGDSYGSGDVIGMAYDGDNNTLTFYKNNSSQGAIKIADDSYHFAVSFGAGSAGGTPAVINFGQRPFTYTPPTNHLAVCTQNLPTPTILNPSEHVGVSTWTGTDTNAANTITGLGFSPDLIWSKSRSHNYNHQLIDRIRGGNKTITSINSSEEVTDEQYGYINTFNSDGFTSTPGSGDNDFYNGIGKTYVAWSWNAGANSNRTYNVKVVSDSGNKYRFNDHGTSAVTLDLEEGSTYVFDSSDSSVDSHPFVLGTAANSGQYGTGVTYTLDGVEKTYSQYTSGFSAATTRKLTITVPSGAPTLYYWCSVHSGMGGQINTGSGGSTILSNSLTSSAYNTSATWSSSSGTGVSNATNIFDGDLSTGGAISSSGTARTLTTSSFSARRIRFYKNGNSEGITYVGVNGTDYALPYSATSTGWVEVDLGSTITVTSLTTTWAPGSFTLYAIEVDGAILVDDNATPPSTPTKNAIVRANPDAGFSIIKYVTSNADTIAQATFATGLGGPAEMVLIKPLYDGGQGWTVYHKDIEKATYVSSNTGNSTQDYLHLESAAAATDSGVDTFAPLHYTFGCRGSRLVAGDDRDIIVYAWRSIPGYSKISYYTGTGTSGDGPFVHTGFAPRWIMVKNAADTDSAAADWLIYDTERTPINAVDDALYPNKNNGETAETGHAFDIVSNGFKIRSTSASGLSNQSGKVFVYAAFAEYPFRTTRAR